MELFVDWKLQTGSVVCSRRAPTPSYLASIFKHVCKLELKIFRHGVIVTSNFTIPIAFSWDLLSLNSNSFFSRVRRGNLTSARFSMNVSKYVIMPKNYWSSFTEFSRSIFVIVSFLRGQLLHLQMIQYVEEIQWSLHQFGICFYLTLVLRIFKNTLLKGSLCSARVLHHAIISSWELALPGTSEIMEVMSSWKTSLVEWIPKCNRLKR